MKKLVNFAVFNICCSVLIFEVILLKFFTFKMIASWAALIVSIAFLGIGASGVYVHLKKSENLQRADFSFLSNFSIAYTISIPVSIMLFAWIPFSPPQGLVLENIIFNLFYMILFLIPFFLSGACISYILSLREFQVGKILFFDLMGAGLGCVLAVLLLRILGAYGVLILSISFAYLSSMIFTHLSFKRQRDSFIKLKIFLPIFLCLTLLVYPNITSHFYQFDIVSTNREEHHFKIFKEDFHGIEATYWNPITRIDLSKEGESDRYEYLFGLSEKYRNKKYTGRYILLDSGAATRQFRLNEDEKDNEFLGHFLFSIPYHLRENINNVLVIGPGGGLEILIGKYFKVKHIDAVDINPDIIDILKGRNKNDPMSEIYSRLTLGNNITSVNYYNEEGRSFLSKNVVSKYDIVQLTGVDLLSSLLSGGMILSENYLYTQEALGYYYDALKEDGYVQLCYWGGAYALRLFITAIEMLEDKGVDCPERSLIVIDDNEHFANIVIKKGFFTSDEVTEICGLCEEDGFRILFIPNMALNEEKYVSTEISPDYLLASKKESRKALIKSSLYNLEPTSDDNPFFYSIHSAKKDNIFKGIAIFLFQNKITLILTVVGVILSFVFILLPLIVRWLKLKRVERIPFKFLPFFGLVGLAFSLIEITILQKFAIFAGGPFYSMCITLPTILIFYSLGALFTTKIKLSRAWLLTISIGCITLYSLFGYLFFDELIKNFFYLSHFQRIILSIMVISPLGFFIGFPTPVVLEAIKDTVLRSAIPWMWGVNSCTNVIGAILFFPISQMTGFNLLLFISGSLYLLALLSLLPQMQILIRK